MKESGWLSEHMFYPFTLSLSLTFFFHFFNRYEHGVRIRKRGREKARD